MNCPFCLSKKPLTTTKTRQRKASVIRYHKCPECGRKMRSLSFLDVKINPSNKASITTRANSVAASAKSNF